MPVELAISHDMGWKEVILIPSRPAHEPVGELLPEDGGLPMRYRCAEERRAFLVEVNEEDQVVLSE